MSTTKDLVPDADSPLALARKLVGLAAEQKDALDRGAAAQFDWLSLRREEVTARLVAIAQAGAQATAAEAAHIGKLQRKLAQLDAGMQVELRRRMAAAREARGQVRRFKKAVAPYYQAGPRVPTFIDQTN
jgi:hypothetical protein